MDNMCMGGDLVQGLGGRGRRVSAENFFCRPPQIAKFGGDGGGLTVMSLGTKCWLSVGHFMAPSYRIVSEYLLG